MKNDNAINFCEAVQNVYSKVYFILINKNILQKSISATEIINYNELEG